MKMLQVKPQDPQAVARLNDVMTQAGSPAMPLRYIESAHLANEGTARVK